MSGWIKLHRKIKDHWIWNNHLYLKAWITILLTVNYEAKKVLIEGELIDCNEGQAVYSLGSWVKILGKGWTMQRVRTFFELLKADEMINTEGLRKTTRLTVCKYADYQIIQQGDNKEVTSKQQGDNKEITTTKERKEIKEGKEINIIYPVGFESIIENWLKYKSERKESYKSKTGLDKFIKHLLNISNNDPAIAQKIIDQSMANNWAGIFELKTTAKPQQNGNGIDISAFTRK